MRPSHHLQDEEFVDLIDDALPEARAAHVAGCASCRQRAQAVRAVLARTSQVTVPEPSPLFWDHLAARIRDDIAASAPARGWREWTWRPAAVWASVAACLVLITTAGYLSLTPRAPGPATAVARASSPATDLDSANPVDEPADDIEADEAWAMVRSVAEDVAWDDAHDAGISARPGTADRMVLEMTRSERSELARLLEDELKRRGA